MTLCAKTLKTDKTSIAESIDLATQAILNSECVAVPTETVYGLAANAFDLKSVAQVFEAKGRPKFDPLIVHIPSQSEDPFSDLLETGLIDCDRLSQKKTKLLQILCRTYWPGPLTLLLPRSRKIHDLITAGSDWVAIRMPNHPVFQKFLLECKVPLVAPSANRFGKISPTTAHDVFKELGNKIRFILDGGACSFGVESTIIDPISSEGLILYRAGALPTTDLQMVTGLIVSTLDPLHVKEKRPSPGTLKSHYAPSKKLILFETIEQANSFARPQTALVFNTHEEQKTFGTSIENFKKSVVVSQSKETHNSFGVAKELFATLRQLDEDLSVDTILWKKPIRKGELWDAISDRLNRASAEEHA